eukprot:363017-Chlamydomonas_euryale.AAC.9
MPGIGVRDPSKYEGVLPHHERLSVVAGDVTKLDTVTAACAGASGVIFAASSAVSAAWQTLACGYGYSCMFADVWRSVNACSDVRCTCLK